MLVPGDVFIFPLVGLGLLHRIRSDDAQNRLRHRLILPAVVITVGSMLALIDIGVTSWAVNTLVLDAVVAAIFLGILAYVRQRKLDPGLMARAVTISGVIVSLIVFAQRGYRPSATFAQTNMTAHFLAACFVFTLIKGTNRIRLTAGPLIVGAVVLTSSFGALLSIVAVIAWFGYGSMRARLRTTSPVLVALLWVLMVGAVGLAAKNSVIKTLSSGESEGLSQKRLDKSESGRKDIWLDGLHALQDDPLGIGPGGFKPLGIHTKVVDGVLDTSEIHHDFIGYLVERGYIGVIGLVLLYAVLWLAGKKRGVVRGMLLMNFTGGLFRETLHFRHLWIYLAVAVAAELSTDPGSIARVVRGRTRTVQVAALAPAARSSRATRYTRSRANAGAAATQLSAPRRGRPTR